MEQYLGDSLASRRTAILEALGGERPTPVGGSRSIAPIGADWESGISQANTLPRSSQPSQPPTVADGPSPLELAARQLASEEDTRRFHTAPPPAEQAYEPEVEPRATLARWAAAGGVLSLILALVWAFALPSGSATTTQAKLKKVQAASAPAMAAAVEPPVVPLTALPASEPVADAPVEANPEPLQAEPASDATPLSVQALPMLKERSAKAVKTRAPGSPRPAVAPRPAPAPAPAAPAPAPAKPKRKVVDDGF
jgi:hypothetical protein